MTAASKRASNKLDLSMLGSATCITAWTAFGDRVRNQIDFARVDSHLADLVAQSPTDIVILDTKIRDMHLWPAPLLVDPSADERLWLFVLDTAADVEALTPLPTNAAFFKRRLGAATEIAEFLSARFNPVRAHELASLDYLAPQRTFIVRFKGGRTYGLRLDDLVGSDDSALVRFRIAPNGHYFRILQASGARLEVPWDAVLHHAEPAYRYHKSRAATVDDSSRSEAIGLRVRSFRENSGLTISQLAERAGMKRPNLSRLESGKHLPSLDTLERLASALNITLARLVARDAA